MSPTIPLTQALHPEALRIVVLGSFHVTRGDTELNVRLASQRLLALLALRSCWLTRPWVAATLWPDKSEGRASASLRATLSRCEACLRDAIEVNAGRLRLASDVVVDLADSRALALRLVDDATPAESDIGSHAIAALSDDILPGWYEDWVVLEIEEWRQTRLHAIEALADDLASRGRFASAVRAALTAVKADPLRESPHAALIRVHLAEGNQSEALRAFANYRDLLGTELGLPPSPQLRELVAGIESRRRYIAAG